MESSPEGPQDLPGLDAAAECLRIIDVSRGRNPLTQLVGDYQFEDMKTEGPVNCQWRFQAEPVGMSVYGKLKTVLLMECVRCLEPYQVPVSLDLHERYVFEASIEQQGKERELHADDFYEVIDEEGELDLKDLAHQFLFLESMNHPNCERPECGFA